MAKANRGSVESLSMTHPVLTGESRSDWALWQLSFSLAEIAKLGVKSESDSGLSVEKKMRQKVNNVKVDPTIEDTRDV